MVPFAVLFKTSFEIVKIVVKQRSVSQGVNLITQLVVLFLIIASQLIHRNPD